MGVNGAAALEQAIGRLSWSQPVSLIVIPAGSPDNVAAMRVGVKEHDSFSCQMPRRRFVSGSALGTPCQPLLEGTDHRVDGCISLNR
jgi:hypothetical protein